MENVGKLWREKDTPPDKVKFRRVKRLLSDLYFGVLNFSSLTDFDFRSNSRGVHGKIF